MELGHEYGTASGLSSVDYHHLGLRFEGESFQIDAGESWVLSRQGKSVTAPVTMRGWFTSLWRTAGGTVYVPSAFSQLLVFSAAERKHPQLQTIPLEGTLTGVWGLSDDDLFVWGRWKGQPVMYRGARDQWTQIPSPGPVL